MVEIHIPRQLHCPVLLKQLRKLLRCLKFCLVLRVGLVELSVCHNLILLRLLLLVINFTNFRLPRANTPRFVYNFHFSWVDGRRVLFEVFKVVELHLFELVIQ